MAYSGINKASAALASAAAMSTRRAMLLAALGTGLGMLAGCSRSRVSSGDGRAVSRTAPGTGTSASPRAYTIGDRIPKGGGSYKIGTPYRIGGRWYTPAEDPGYDRSGIASWYGEDFHGRKTANGEIFDMNALTAAHPTLPIPSYAYVTNLANGRTLLVRINDRGPYAQDRILDLSRMSARVLGTEVQGLAQVRVKYAGRAPLDGNDAHEQRHLASQPWGRTFAGGPAGRMSLGAAGE